jgi:hypothetical protein
MRTLLLLCILVCAPLLSHAADENQLPIFDYTPRYRCVYLGETRLFIDSARGTIRTAIRAAHGLERWRTYELREMAAGRDDTENTIPKSSRAIHGRFALAGTDAEGNMLFLDTLTGYIWSCRHSEGRLELWKRYGPEEANTGDED